MKLFAVVAALMLGPGASAEAKPQEKYRHAGCNTHKCDRRMDRKEHAKTLRKWARVVRPFRAWLYSTRMCESGGRYNIATGNGFYGAYQFVVSTWYSVGGRGMPHLAEPAEQDYRATLLRMRDGTGPWPVCG
jgi:hypothetical protein